MAKDTLTITEARAFFLQNLPVQFKVTDQKGNSVTRWVNGTTENVIEKLDALEQNDVFQPGTYYIRTRTSAAKGSHNATFCVVKIGAQNLAAPAIDDRPAPSNTAAEKMGVSEILAILSENKILTFKVETLEKTIEHLNHEIDRLEEEIEAGHHEKSGINDGILSALLPLGDRLLSIIESRSTPTLADVGAAAPVYTRPPAAPIAPPPVSTVAIDPRSTAGRPAPPAAPAPATSAGAPAQDQPSDVEKIAALIIERVENNPDDPNALGAQMMALLEQRPDIYEKVSQLIQAYFNA